MLRSEKVLVWPRSSACSLLLPHLPSDFLLTFDWRLFSLISSGKNVWGEEVLSLRGFWAHIFTSTAHMTSLNKAKESKRGIWVVHYADEIFFNIQFTLHASNIYPLALWLSFLLVLVPNLPPFQEGVVRGWGKPTFLDRLCNTKPVN